MKNLLKVLAIIAITAIVGLSMVSCTTFATNKEVPQKTIPILGIVSGKLVPQGEVIASYTKLLGFCIGYDDFVQAVSRYSDYDVYEKTYFVFSKVSAVRK